MASQLFDHVKSRRNFYRDCYRREAQILYVIIILIVLMFGANLYMYAVRGESQYFATSNEGGVVSLRAMNAPNYADQPLMSDEESQ